MGQQMGNPILIHADGMDFSVMGQARRLDMTGAVCEFTDTGQGLANVKQMDILALHEPNRCLLGLPCTVVQDGLSKEQLPFGSLPMRRIELRFKSLSEEQQQKLWILLGWLSLKEMRTHSKTLRTSYNYYHTEPWGWKHL